VKHPPRSPRFDGLDSIGSILPDPIVPNADGGNPGRAGRDADAFRAAQARGRYELAHRLNPDITPERWAKIIAKGPRGRKPKGGRIV
jgi:hypothetical protein